MQDKNCLFCKIAKGEIPSKKVFENESFLGLLDINPKSKGHSLIIPKEHYANFLEMPQDLEKEMFAAAQKLAKKLKEKLKSEYVFLLVMGIDMPHTHVHLIPSYHEAPDDYSVKLGRTRECNLDAVLEEINKEDELK